MDIWIVLIFGCCEKMVSKLLLAFLILTLLHVYVGIEL